MAHLGCCIDWHGGAAIVSSAWCTTRRCSGGFITSGLIADACDALPEAEIRVMRIPAMARVTKLSENVLTALSASNPVFAPGVQNYLRMGGVRALWQADLKAGLRDALTQASTEDRRAIDGRERGGRLLAASWWSRSWRLELAPTPHPIKPLRRHQLVWLDEFGWYRTLATAASSSSRSGQPTAAAAETLECLEHWAEQRWPLVVTRQPIEPTGRRVGPSLGSRTRRTRAMGAPSDRRFGLDARCREDRASLPSSAPSSRTCRRRHRPARGGCASVSRAWALRRAPTAAMAGRN
jgi:hypothetical protein